MSGSTAVTGTLGQAVVDGERIARLTAWSLQESDGEMAWGDSDSSGHTNRKAGRLDRTGTISGKFDSDSPPYQVFRSGDIVTLALWITSAAGHYYAFPSAKISNFRLDIDQDSKQVIGWSADFGEDGKSYYPGEAGAPSYTLPA